MRRWGVVLGALLWFAATAVAGAAEWNPVRREPVSIGPEAGRIIVGFRTTAANALTTTIKSRMHAQAFKIVQAATTAQDVAALGARVGIATARTRQLTPSMHVLFLEKKLYGADVAAALAKLRADPAVAFAAVDHRRYALAVPNDPLFPVTATAVCAPSNGCTPTQDYDNGQWYMRTPPAAATPTNDDLAATDAVSAWGLTPGSPGGSTGVVIADVDTGVRFDHPDLLRAGLGGRLLPGYDFVGQDYDPTTFKALGTYLIANDGDGWDPDPSDPGDWVTAAEEQTALFPAAQCGTPPVDSSWHGTRVSGILGALTNNGTGIAGMSWGPWLLPVRALGKCGGYDSDIITAIEWAAGMPVAGVPNNPYPANIINLSLGGTGSCSTAYESALSKVTGLGVLVVASAGNGGNPGSTAPVDAPANCSALVPGVVAVAGLRNVGTKVGYSSSGPEVTLSAPAGNCVQSSGACLRSIDTTMNAGTTTPTTNGYSDQINVNLGTSFSAPIVAGIAALMRSVNANLTPAELSSRLAASAKPFPANTANLPVCPLSDAVTGECACPPGGQCGTGMVNALAAVDSALRPIAAVAVLASNSFDASGSAASCNRTIASYAWSTSGSVVLTSAANGPTATTSGGPGTVTLVVTDSVGATDTAVINVSSTGATTTAPATAGTAQTACPAAVSVNPMAPTIGEAFVPTSVGENTASTLTITFTNTNAYALTQASFDYTLPANLTIPATPKTTTSCGGGQISATYNTTSVMITDAVIPASGSCTIVMPVQSATAGTYVSTIAANTLSTGPAGANTASASASLTVTAPSHGGALGWPDILVGAGLVYVARRRALRGAARV